MTSAAAVHHYACRDVVRSCAADVLLSPPIRSRHASALTRWEHAKQRIGWIPIHRYTRGRKRRALALAARPVVCGHLVVAQRMPTRAHPLPQLDAPPPLATRLPARARLCIKVLVHIGFDQPVGIR
jgi:hypothetical protein